MRFTTHGTSTTSGCTGAPLLAGMPHSSTSVGGAPFHAR